jgi:hypothetical protein
VVEDHPPKAAVVRLSKISEQIPSLFDHDDDD